MDDNFYKENLSDVLGDKEKIIRRFQKWWPSEEEIRSVLEDKRICPSAYLLNIEQMAKKGLLKKLDHKEYATILYQNVGEKFLQEQNDPDKRSAFLAKIFRAEAKQDPSKEDEINELIKKTFILESVPEYTSDEFESFLRNEIQGPSYFSMKFLGPLIDIINLPTVCAQKIPKGKPWKSEVLEPLAPVNPLYDFQRDISKQIERMLTTYSDKTSRAMIALPTGSGKTRVIVESVIDWINKGKEGQKEKKFILWMVERKELCQQAFETFKTMFLFKGKKDSSLELLVFWGNKTKNVEDVLNDYEEALEDAQVTRTSIIIASRGSLHSIATKDESRLDNIAERNFDGQRYKKLSADNKKWVVKEYQAQGDDRSLQKLGKQLSLVIIDEAHGAMGDSTGFVLNSLGFNFQKDEVHPHHVRLIGLTATPFKNPTKESHANHRSDSEKRVYTATEKLQSRFGNRFLWPDIESSSLTNQDNQPHAIMELQKRGTVGNDILISGKRSFDQDGRIEEYYWQVKIRQSSYNRSKDPYKYDTGRKNGFESTPEENLRLWRRQKSSEIKKEEEIWAGKQADDIFNEPGTYDVFLWVKDNDGLVSQIEEKRTISVIAPKEKDEVDDQRKMQQILKQLKKQDVLAKKKRWIITHDLSHLRGIEFQELLGRRTGELTPDSLEKISEDADFNEKIIRVVDKLIHKDERKSILVFANTVTHAKLLSTMIRSSIEENGKPVTSEFIHAGTHNDERCRFIKEFREQKLRVLCNYDILTQGFDAPKVDAIVLARDTGSYVLRQQMIGRGLRGPRNGGTPECRVVDFNNKIREQLRGLSEDELLYNWQFHEEDWDDDREISDFELGFKKLDDVKWPDYSYEVAYDAWKKGSELSVREKKNLFRLFTENPEYQEWQPEFWKYIKEIHEKLQEELSKSLLDEPAITGLDLEDHVASPDKKSFDDLIDFIDNIMQMEAVYQPVMIKFLLTQPYYTASRRQIASELASADHSPGPKDYEKVSVYHVLTDHHIVNTEARSTMSEDLFTLNVKDLTERQKGILDGKLEIAITKFINRHGTQEKIVLPDNSEILFESNPKAIGRNNFSNYLQSKNENLHKISRVQFTISQESGHCYIEDGVTSVQEKPSANGTTVNGQDITGQGRKELENGNVIELSSVAEVTFQSTKTDEKKTMSTDEIVEHTCPKCNKVNVKYHEPPTEEENELIEKSFGWRGNRIQSWCKMCRS